MDRKSKEEFVEKAWEHFKRPDDTVEKPVFANLTDAGLDSMHMYFSYCYQEEEKEASRWDGSQSFLERRRKQ